MARPHRSYRARLVLRRFRRHRLALAGLSGLALLVLVAALGPSAGPWRYGDIDPTAFLQPPSRDHLLGTTQAGRDVLALTVHGLSRSLVVGCTAAVLQTGIAAVVGAAAAYAGGWLERVSFWIVDLCLIVPSFLIVATLMRGSAGGRASWLLLAVFLALFGWPLTARVVRSLTLSLKHREYVVAARFMGLPAWRIVARHILPNLASLLIVDATLNVGSAVLAETGLSFLGFGVQAPDASLGTLIGDGARMATAFPWLFLAPAAPLVALVLCVNAVGDGLRDALDPAAPSGGPA
jgi:peptide/nickel transport system permease protein